MNSLTITLRGNITIRVIMYRRSLVITGISNFISRCCHSRFPVRSRVSGVLRPSLLKFSFNLGAEPSFIPNFGQFLKIWHHFTFEVQLFKFISVPSVTGVEQQRSVLQLVILLIFVSRF